MAKVSLARKKELNEPDAFIEKSGQVAKLIQENKEKVIGAVIAVALIIVGISGYITYSDYHNKKAFTALAKDIAWLEGNGTETAPKRSLEEIQKRSEVFFSSYSGTMAGTLARSKYAGIFYNEGDYKSAVALYERLVKDLKHDPALQNTALGGLAYCYEALGEDDKALTVFQKIADGASPVKKDDALFHIGLIYEKKGETDKSRQAFQKIVDSYPDSLFIDIAKEKTAG